MTIGDHREGFEDVRKISELMQVHGTLRAVRKILGDDFCDKAYERRPCRRKLRYIGYDNWDEPTRSEMNAEGHEYFVRGEIYYSTDFNGGTYSIQGWSENNEGWVMGCAFFEWIKDLEDENGSPRRKQRGI